MKTEVDQENGVTTIAPQGSLDALTAPELSAVLREQIAGGYINLVVDLAKVTFMSSAGLRSLLGGIKEARSKGGDLRIVSPSPNIDKLLRMSGFHTIAKVFTTPADAVASYMPQP